MSKIKRLTGGRKRWMAGSESAGARFPPRSAPTHPTGGPHLLRPGVPSPAQHEAWGAHLSSRTARKSRKPFKQQLSGGRHSRQVTQAADGLPAGDTGGEQPQAPVRPRLFQLYLTPWDWGSPSAQNWGSRSRDRRRSPCRGAGSKRQA